MLYFTVSNLLTKKEYLYQLAKFAFAGAIGIIGFIAYGLISGEGLWSQYTPLSTDGVRTLAFTHAFYLSMAVIGVIIYVINKIDFNKYLLLLIPVWVVGIIGSMMRHLWVSLAAASIFIYFYASKESKKAVRKNVAFYTMILSISMISSAYFITLFPNSFLYQDITSTLGMVSNRVTSITDADDESIMWRSVVWKESLKKYLESPILGVGLGEKVSVEIGKYRDFVEIRNIHNSFLVLFVQMGLLGIGSISLLIIGLVKNIWKKIFQDEKMDIAKQTVLAILVFQLVAFMFQPYLEANLLGIFFWINLGILRVINKN